MVERTSATRRRKASSGGSVVFQSKYDRFRMATVTTYLLISGSGEGDQIRSHQLLDRYDFQEREASPSADRQLPTVVFVLEQPLEDVDDLEEEILAFSADIPDATVVLCEVEERFDQIERLNLVVFEDGKRGGDVEHGYLFNIGSD